MSFSYDKYTASDEWGIHYLQKLEKIGDQIALMRKAEQHVFWRKTLFVTKNELPQIIHDLLKRYELAEQSYLDLVKIQNEQYQNTIKELAFNESLNEFLESDHYPKSANIEATQLQLL